MKRQLHPSVNKHKLLATVGTLKDLAEATGVSRRHLYRLQKLGVFHSEVRLSQRTVYYDLLMCRKAIDYWARRGKFLEYE
jgi:predicted DNA-binding transcriptional regulator AlpA